MQDPCFEKHNIAFDDKEVTWHYFELLLECKNERQIYTSIYKMVHAWYDVTHQGFFNY